MFGFTKAEVLSNKTAKGTCDFLKVKSSFDLRFGGSSSCVCLMTKRSRVRICIIVLMHNIFPLSAGNKFI